MAVCELSGKGPVVKNLVSHSNIKTKSTAMPNVQSKRLYSQVLDQMFKFNVATSTIRNLEHRGGLDTFILKQPDESLSARALKVKSRINKKVNSKKK